MKRLQRAVLRLPAAGRFRWVKPAASLKRGTAGSFLGELAGGFPLGKTGGLIEAGTARPCDYRPGGLSAG